MTMIPSNLQRICAWIEGSMAGWHSSRLSPIVRLHLRHLIKKHWLAEHSADISLLPYFAEMQDVFIQTAQVS